MSLRQQIVSGQVPKHVAIIMDGNGRWARSQGEARSFGHKQGTDTVRTILEAAKEIGVQTLTLYTFSEENWKRPRKEVEALMSLLVASLRKELEVMHQNKIRLRCIGRVSQLPPYVQHEVEQVMRATAHYADFTLILALSYSARGEITEAARSMARELQEGRLTDLQQIDEQLFKRYLYTADLPDPDLLIRTGGEYRLSNFLLWQAAYTELYFCPTFWPDFGRQDFYRAIISYQSRQRRFGMTGEQVNALGACDDIASPEETTE